MPFTASEIHAVAALELKDRARFIRRGDFEPQPLDNLARGAHVLGIVLGEMAGANPERILQPDTDSPSATD
jgi:hypothetical protein